MTPITHHTAELVAGVANKVSIGAGVGVATGSGVALVSDSVIKANIPPAAIDGITQITVAAPLGLYEWGLIIGIATTVLGFMVSTGITLYFNIKRTRIQQAVAESTIAFNRANSISPKPASDPEFSSKNIHEIDDRL